MQVIWNVDCRVQVFSKDDIWACLKGNMLSQVEKAVKCFL